MPEHIVWASDRSLLGRASQVRLNIWLAFSYDEIGERELSLNDVQDEIEGLLRNKVKMTEHVEKGIQSFPHALNKMFTGDHIYWQNACRCYGYWRKLDEMK